MSESQFSGGGGIEPNLNLGVGNIPTKSLWTWASPDPTYQVPLTVIGYPPGGLVQPTKTGLIPQDLQNFIGVQIQQYGSPIMAVPPEQILQYIRWAEDRIERDTGLLLCQTWVAAAPAVQPDNASSLGVLPQNGTQQVQGVDYDMAEAPYDFFFS